MKLLQLRETWLFFAYLLLSVAAGFCICGYVTKALTLILAAWVARCVAKDIRL